MAMLPKIKKFMLENAYTHTDEWLQACMQWVQSNFADLSEVACKKHVYEQWIDTNLEELRSSCLPTNLAAQKLCSLKGKYGVQMNSIQDIGESAYNQWKQIKKLENENTNVTGAGSNNDDIWAPKPKKCLYLTLTDGSQQVYGLELSPISCLSLSLKPGVKLSLIGPIECRRGVLQLRAANVKFIGGEVESFLQSHSVEAILSSRLNVPGGNQNNPTITQQGFQRTNPSATITSIDDGFPDAIDDDDDKIFMEIDENLLLGGSNYSTATTNSRTLSNSMADTQAIANMNTEIISTQDYNNLGIFSGSSASNTMNQNNNSSISIPTISKTKPKPKTNIPKKPPANVKAATRGAGVTRSSKNTSKKDQPVNAQPSLMQQIGGFQTAKQVAEVGTSKKRGPKPKQLKIDGYMKPMPVIIKPATPPVPGTTITRRVKPTPTSYKLPTPQKPSTSSSSTRNQAEKSIIIVSDSDNDDFSVIDESFTAELDELERRASSGSSTKGTNNQILNTPFPTKSTGIVLPIIPTTKYPIMVSGRPYIYIKQIIDNLDFLAESGNSLHIKACVSTVNSNIQVSNGAWTLTVSLNDGTGFLNCKLSAELLNKIIGFNPAEMKRLKSMKTPTGKEQISQGMKELTEKLVHLNAIVEIQLSPEPVIVNFTDIYMNHVNAVKHRTSVL